MSSSNVNEGKRILVLDGGMGTTLENLGVDVSSSLWGSDLLLTDPAPITQVHKGYIEAGADLIETATYPLSVDGIRREYPDKSVDEAESILHKGLSTALSASSSSSISVVLALGPYGATTKPGAEYSGLYAPPYGFGTVLDPSPSNYAPDDIAHSAEDALSTFHAERIRSYARSDQWGSVGWIGFETIPLAREVKAIRRALDAITPESDKNIWIACTFPDGQSPQSISDGNKLSVEEAVRSLLSGEGRRPDGIGINCTNPAYIPALVDTFNDTLRSLPLQDSKPWFVLYPDGGQVYEPISRTWSKEKLTADQWADRMMEVIVKVDKSGLWAGIIAGGCCKTSAEEIKELRRRVDRYLELA